MKKSIVLFIATLFTQTIFSQGVEQWEWQGFSIGQGAIGPAYTTETFMPEVVRIGSQYIMYYTGRYNNRSAILYATSPDMMSWTVQDTIMVGSSDTTNREYEIGGPSVVKTSSGQYRMYYRCCQRFTTSTPLYHIRSAISSNGTSFTKEGIRIEIANYQANAYFTLAGQSAFYIDAGGNYRAIITGSDTGMTNSTSRLYTAQSNDGGLTWGSFVPLWDNAHDPVVVIDSLGGYHLYCSYLMQGHRKAESPNGAGWPTSSDSILLKRGTNYLTEQSSPDMIADLGAACDSLGNIILFSNYKPAAPGPWQNIAYYYFQSTSGITEHSRANDLIAFPDPAADHFTIRTISNAGEQTISFFNALGENIFETTFSKELVIETSNWQKGIYFFRSGNSSGKIMIR